MKKWWENCVFTFSVSRDTFLWHHSPSLLHKTVDRDWRLTCGWLNDICWSGGRERKQSDKQEEKEYLFLQKKKKMHLLGWFYWSCVHVQWAVMDACERNEEKRSANFWPRAGQDKWLKKSKYVLVFKIYVRRSIGVFDRAHLKPQLWDRSSSWPLCSCRCELASRCRNSPLIQTRDQQPDME